ncbi:MAG: DUF4157 domain-containing protein [Kofleriaceae bacterium]
MGGRAATATKAMGARAFASCEVVAFETPPDLRQAAHEAAHVIQQRAGVQLAGGVGRVGDRYEQHADAVAERVVRGQSAEALLDTVAGSGSASASGAAVQRDGEDDERLEEDGDREAILRRAAARRRGPRSPESAERVARPGDREALEEDVTERHGAERDEQHERVAEPGDADELVRRVREHRGEPMSDHEREFRADRADPSTEGTARRREGRRRDASEREARPGDREAITNEVLERRRARLTTDEERGALFRREDFHHDRAVAGLTRITEDDPTSGSVTTDGADVRPHAEVEGHVRVSRRGARVGTTVGPSARRGRVMAGGEALEDGGTRAGVDVRGSTRVGGHGVHGDLGASVRSRSAAARRA